MIKRQILPQVIDHLSKPEITVLLGPRQVGKTTLMQMMQDHLRSKPEQESATILSYNLDLIRDLELFADQQRVIDTINLSRGDQKAYVFIDEIQRIPQAGLFIKGIFDQAKNDYKLIISGSSTLEINQQIAEPLTGRKLIFRIRPLDLKEILLDRYPSSANLTEFARLQSRELNACLDEYLRFGGYPRVVLADSAQEKMTLLGEIYESYLQKDIVNLLQIEKLSAFTKLTTLLSEQIGNLVNTNELSATLNIAHSTVSNYLSFLEQTFIISLLRPFANNPRTEISKMPKVYFQDPGIRNYALQRFEPFADRPDKGALFENLIFLLLFRCISIPHKINYWRTKSGAEVDFITSLAGTNPSAYEVKAQTNPRLKASRSLQSFITKYQVEQASLVSLNPTAQEHDKVSYLPYWELLNR